MHTLFKEFTVPEDGETLQQELEMLLDKYRAHYDKAEQYKKAFGYIDYTSLNATDTEQSIIEKADKISNFHKIPRHIGVPNVAAFVVYPRFVPAVKARLKTKYVQIASVAAGFPASQTLPEIKEAEVKAAVEAGASEIDVVMTPGLMLAGKYEEAYEEIRKIREAAGDQHLKVILETGALENAPLIYKASLLAMEAGADFIKTSTGKEFPGASPFAAYVMTLAIRDYYAKRRRMVGLKPAGGISRPEQVTDYVVIVAQILGKQWLSKDYFRIGASRLANGILNRIIQTDLDDAQARNYF